MARRLGMRGICNGWLATKVTATPVRSAARNSISLMTFGQASASTQIFAPATFHPRRAYALAAQYTRLRCAARKAGAPARSNSVIPRLAAHRQRQAHRGVIPFTLLAPVCGMLFFAAKAVHGAAQRLGLDAFFAPQCAPRFVFRARGLERLVVQAQRLAQAVEEAAIVLQFHRIDGARGAGGIAHVLVAIRVQLFELALQVFDLAARIRHRQAQILGRARGDLLNGLESFRFLHGRSTIGRLPPPAPRTASRVAEGPRNCVRFPPVRTCPDAGNRAFWAIVPRPGPPARPRRADTRPR